MYTRTIRFPCYNVRNLAFILCLTLSRKYFSRNLVLKEVQVTSSTRVCISCCIPYHQYSASATSKNVTNESFFASVHSITLYIFSHSLSQASALSRVALRVNLEGLCLTKSSIVIGRACATMALGCAAMGYIASIIR